MLTCINRLDWSFKIKILIFSFGFLRLQVSKPSQEAYQNELNIESVERSFILSARLDFSDFPAAL